MKTTNSWQQNFLLNEALRNMTSVFPHSAINICKKIVCEEYGIDSMSDMNSYVHAEARYVAMSILVEILPSVSKNYIQSFFYPIEQNNVVIERGVEIIEVKMLKKKFRDWYQKLREKVWRSCPNTPLWNFEAELSRRNQLLLIRRKNSKR